MASDPYRREAEVVRWLRIAIGFTVALGAAAVALGHVEYIVWDMDYVEHVERAGSDQLTLFTIVALVPALFVFQRPRWPPIVLWLFWLMPWLLFALDGVGSDRPTKSVDIEPLLIQALLAGIFCMVALVLPILRSLHKTPPDHLPAMRAVRVGK